MLSAMALVTVKEIAVTRAEAHLNNFFHFGETQLSVKGMNTAAGQITNRAADFLQLFGHEFRCTKAVSATCSAAQHQQFGDTLLAELLLVQCVERFAGADGAKRGIR